MKKKHSYKEYINNKLQQENTNHLLSHREKGKTAVAEKNKIIKQAQEEFENNIQVVISSKDKGIVTGRNLPTIRRYKRKDEREE